MNIDEILLTDGEQSQAIQQGAKGWFAALNTPAGNEFLESIADSLCKAQCLKLLEWLKKEDMLAHDSFGHTAYKQDGEWVEGELHSPNCQVCKVMSELESKLKEG